MFILSHSVSSPEQAGDTSLAPFKRRLVPTLSRIAGVFIAIPECVLLLLAVGKPLSVLGWLSIGVSVGIVAGLLVAGRKGRWMIGASMLVALATILVVIAMPSNRGAPFLSAVVLPSGDSASRWQRLIRERDAAIIGSGMLYHSGLITAYEYDELIPSLATVYDELDQDDPLLVSPIIRTGLGLQEAERSDAFLHVEGDGTMWVVFLHGMFGNNVSGCWVIAQAAAQSGWSTMCPSTDITGRWDLADGPTIVHAAIENVRSRGAQRLVLAGFSNGGFGASRLAEQLCRELDGLILMSGVDSSMPPTSLPTLIVYGENEASFSANRLEDLTEALPNGELVVLENADHMLLVKRCDDITPILTSFLRTL